MNNFIDFTGQVCVVTGAGSEGGIGFSCAKIFTELGGKVALLATGDRILERAEELKTMGGEAKGYVADLTDRDQVEKVVAEIISDFGKIDVLINNAGNSKIVPKGQPQPNFDELTYAQWDKLLEMNLGLTFNMTRNVIPYMEKAGYGRVVNISSVTGPVVSTSGDAGYSAAKAAINGMSKVLAIEVGKFGITVNNVRPGWIKTEMQSKRGKMGGENTPLGRSSTPMEVANMAIFLASDKASYITGQDFIVDGGNVIQEFKGSDKELAALG